MSELCPTCKKPFNWRRKMLINGIPFEKVGRPRGVDYNLVYKLRDRGLSILKIAEELKISRGTVQHALNIRNEEAP